MNNSPQSINKQVEEKTIVLEYLDLKDEDLVHEARSKLDPRLEAHALKIKWKILKKFFCIEKEPDLEPMDAWIKHLCRINKIEYSKPCDPVLSEVLLKDPRATKFMYFLAH